ncbi:MAG: hypothetical protein V4632_09815 [Pseudomonadota bacterium]
MKKLFAALFLSAVILNNAFAAPISSYGVLTNIRPYNEGTIYVTHSSGTCGTTVFSVSTTTIGGKAIYAAALIALTTQKQVAIEVAPVACAWGMPIQSIFVSQ